MFLCVLLLLISIELDLVSSVKKFTIPSRTMETKRSEIKGYETTVTGWPQEAIDESYDTDTEKPVTALNISVAKALTKFKIVPEIVPTAPRTGIQITYGPSTFVNYGNFLSEREVECPPERIYWKAESKEYYTLIMLASNFSSGNCSFQREWLQWMVGNIPGNTWGAGEILAEYMFLSRARDARMCVFLVFEQRDKIDYDKKFHAGRAPDKYIQPIFLRPFFSTKSFAKKFKLREALAVNFFQIKPKMVCK